MCVKIFYSKKSTIYDPQKSLTKQLNGCKEIVIDYNTKDTSIEKFLDEVEKMCDAGNSMKLNIKVVHNNQIKGASVKKRVTKLSFETELNEFIKMVALAHHEVDKKLEEISTMCMSKCEDE